MSRNNTTTKKSLLFVLLCIFAAGLVFAQAGTADLTKRFLQRADDQYSEMKYEDAFKTINSALKLSERDEVPGNVYLLATQIYTKLLEKMTKTRDFALYNDVVMNLQTYPKLSDDPQIQKYVRMIQQMQTDMKDEAREAKNRQMMESISAQTQANNEEMVKTITQSQQESSRQMLDSLTDKMQASNNSLIEGVTTTMNTTIDRMDKRSNKTIWIIAIGASLSYAHFVACERLFVFPPEAM